MRILITGSNGLLGQKLVERCKKHQIEFLATSKGQNRNPACDQQNYLEMDIVSAGAIEKVFHAFNPTHVIHTAAITNVDYCELHPEECKLVNTHAVQLLYSATKKFNAHFQLLSTDFVFDGEKGNYNENDEVNPLSCYAQSKVDAENLLIKSDKYANWSIVRTIIVYGTGNNLSRSNIVLWAKESLLKGETLRIVDDQFRAPTFAEDLAWACVELCAKNKNGIFHVCGPETMSIYELVCRVANYYRLPNEHIHPVKSADLKQPAQRPPITGFDISKVKKQIGYAPKTLEETLAKL